MGDYTYLSWRNAAADREAIGAAPWALLSG